MLDHNVTTIARALGGTVPDGGFAGQREIDDKNENQNDEH